MTRLETITQELPLELTGLKARIFVHVDHRDGRVEGVRFSEKRHDTTLDRLLTALGNALSGIVKEIQNG